MPATLTYPGVYIEEIPSGVRTIVGVSTSIAAFVGPAKSGPTNTPITIESFGEFEKAFGGLWALSPMSYAVQDFYSNGGGQAIIVRIVDAVAAAATVTADSLALKALSEGAWGNTLKVRIEHPSATDTFADDIAGHITPQGATPLTHADLFHLIIWDTASGTTERFDNLTVKESTRRADRVLQLQSKLMKITTALPGSPAAALPAANADPAAGKTAFTDTATANVWHNADANSGKDNAGALGDAAYHGDGLKTGIFSLEQADIFNILCIPPPTLGGDTSNTVWTEAADYCKKRRAFLLVDPPAAWNSKDSARTGLPALFQAVGTEGAKYSAVYFPLLTRIDKFGMPLNLVPCGAVAGVFARTDEQRAVWKAPAGLDAGVVGADALSVNVSAADQGQLNPIGINCLRVLPAAGRVVYGARTLAGNDMLASEWKYVPIRRLALFIEESLFRGTQWVVFEPNDEPLWAQIRASVGGFMHGLFRQGAFEGSSPQDAYYVRCDNKTTTETDRNLGIVNIEVGFLPLKPAEFVVIKIQQMAGQAG